MAQPLRRDPLEVAARLQPFLGTSLHTDDPLRVPAPTRDGHPDVCSVDDSSAAELRPSRHFGRKPGYLNTVTYIAPSSEVSTFLVTAYRYNGLPIPMPYSTTSHPRNTRPPTTLTSGRPGTALPGRREGDDVPLAVALRALSDLRTVVSYPYRSGDIPDETCVRQWNQ